MKEDLKYTLMVIGMVVSWSIYYAVSKVVVVATGSALLAGFLLRTAALVFLTIQLLADKNFARLFHQGKAVKILLLIGVFGFLLDLFANLGYAHGSLSTGTALLKTDVVMVNLATVILYHKKLYLSDWLGTLVMLGGVLLVLGVDFGGMTFHATDLYFLLSAACVSANAFIIKAAQEKYHEDADMISYYNNAVVLILFGASAALHGDFHIRNVMLQDGEALLIDMDTLCYGHPVFELASTYNAYCGYGIVDHDIIRDFMGFPYETAHKLWDRILELYLGTKDAAVLDGVERKPAKP